MDIGFRQGLYAIVLLAVAKKWPGEMPHGTGT